MGPIILLRFVVILSLLTPTLTGPYSSHIHPVARLALEATPLATSAHGGKVLVIHSITADPNQLLRLLAQQ